MKRIVIHWTAGTNKPNATDLEHYHFIIDGEGKIHDGKFKPEDNENCNDGKYAHHTGGGNTGSIGISLCGMCGFSGAKSVGDYPLTKIQCETMFQLVAKLCKKYKIQITPQTVLTHYEFGQAHRDTTSYGKIDIIFMPPYPWVAKEDCGSYIRSKIRWYYEKL